MSSVPTLTTRIINNMEFGEGDVKPDICPGIEIKMEEVPVKIVYVLKLKHAVLRLHRIDEKEIKAARSITVKQEPGMTMECSSVTPTLITKNTVDTNTRTQEKATSDNQQFECDFCNRRFMSVAALRIHQNMFHGRKGKTCKICLKRCRDNHKLNIHMLHKHPVKTRFCCTQCPDSGSGINVDKINVANHLQMHGMETADEPESETPEVTSSTDMDRDRDTSSKMIVESRSLTEGIPKPSTSPNKTPTAASDSKFTCKLAECSQEFRTFPDFMTHVKSHGLGNTCVECGKMFKTNFAVKIHMHRSHKAQGQFFPCAKCNRSFTRYRHLAWHLSTTHKDKSGKIFGTRAATIPPLTGPEQQPAAIVTNSPNLPFKCQDCSRRFTTTFGLKIHMKSHNNSGFRMLKKCPKCKKVCRTNWHLQKHMKSHQKFPLKPGSFSFRCPFCVMRFPFQSKLILHCQVYHNSERLDSKTLGGVGDTKLSRAPADSIPIPSVKSASIPTVTTKVTNQEEISTEETQAFRCDACDRSFKTSFGLLIHSKVHSKQPRLCREYNPENAPVDEFLPQSSSQIPSKSPDHTGKFTKPQSVDTVRIPKDLRIKCPNCSRSFRTVFGLNVHTRKAHLGSEINTLRKCKRCGKVFGSLDHLQQHMRVHGDEFHLKSYPCPHCQLRFSLKDRLVTHAQIEHNIQLMSEEIREFVPCPEQITVAETNTSSPIEPDTAVSRQDQGWEDFHFCQICDKRFESSIALLTHSRSHTGARSVSGSPGTPTKSSFQRKSPDTVINEPRLSSTPKSRPNISLASKPGKNNYPCKFCDRSFQTSTGMLIHITRKHPKYRNWHGRVKTNDKCGKVFRSFPGYRQHMLPSSSCRSGNSGSSVVSICSSTSPGVSRTTHSDHWEMSSGTSNGPRMDSTSGSGLSVNSSSGDVSFGGSGRSSSTMILDMNYTSGSSPHVITATSYSISSGYSTASSNSSSRNSPGETSTSDNSISGNSTNGNGPSTSGNGLRGNCPTGNSINGNGTSVIDTCKGKSSNQKIYPCPICEKVFLHKSNLIDHFKTHAPRSKTQETQADVLPVAVSELETPATDTIPKLQIIRHAKSFTPMKTQLFQCQVCSKTFPLRHQLMLHARVHEARPQKEVHPCLFCGKVFLYQSGLELHMVTHTREKAYQCSLCKKEFAYSTELSAHSKNKKCLAVISPKKSAFKCKTCSRCFDSKAGLGRHLLVHRNKSEYLHNCETCGKKFLNQATLLMHMQVHDRERTEKSVQDEIPGFKCDSCGRSFESKAGLGRHAVVHNRAEIMRECLICGKAFTSLANLSMHMKSHNPNQDETVRSVDTDTEPKKLTEKTTTPSKTYTCVDCGKVYLSMCGFRYHCTKLQHKMLPKITLSVVVPGSTSNAVDSSSSLQCETVLSLPSQIPEKNAKLRNKYKCNVCKKSFVTGGALYLHKRCHKGIKAHQSKMHGTNETARATERSLKGNPGNSSNRVLAVKSGGKSGPLTMKLNRIKQLQCNICDKTLSNSQTLILHLKSHLGIREHTCKICNKSFTVQQNLRRHILALHPGAEAE